MHMNKDNRHKLIKEILQSTEINSQEELLNILTLKGIDITQATLSRDIKELKIIKTPTADGTYAYKLPYAAQSFTETPDSVLPFGFTSLGFSGQLAVAKTRPGYAMAIAGEIDAFAKGTILGTVAGDDTILIIPIDGVSREQVITALSNFISPQLKKTIN